MDLRFSPEEIAFRGEVRAFIDANLDPVTRQRMAEGRMASSKQIISWQRTLADRGWATPSWPQRHGGPGWDAVKRYIFLDELHQAPAPEPLSFNVAMIGPVLIHRGTPAQQQRFLEPTARLDIWWAQGFSESAAGSDLAAVRTTARREGDQYVVNGHKMWQGMAHHADWMFTLVRTDPGAAKKQAGLSFLLIDLRLPGVTISPIITADGRHEVNEVFLDEVRVPVDCLVGAENDGWSITKFLLSAERSNIARIGMTKLLLNRIGRMGGGGAAQRRADAIAAELKILEITQLRILDAQRESSAPDPRSSILKLKGVELRQRASELLLDVAGPAALEVRHEDEPSADDEGEWLGAIMPNYTILRAASIFGGASEVQKDILAKAVIGL